MAPVSLGGVFWESMTSGVITEQVLAWMASHQALTYSLLPHLQPAVPLQAEHK